MLHSSSSNGGAFGQSQAVGFFVGANGINTRPQPRLGALEPLPQSRGQNVTGAYSGREQTEAKHFILRRYLQALAFKILTVQDITYVDGFSGPWETKADDFSDSSFMIALSVLRDAQTQILNRTGVRQRIRCFLSENNAEAFAQLEHVVAAFHKPAEGFEVRTFFG